MRRGFVLPEGRTGQAVALALTLAAIVLVWLCVVSPVWNAYSEAADRMDRKAAMVARMRRLAESLPELRQAAEAAPAPAARLAPVEAPTDALATAAIQQLVQSFIARRNGLEMTSLEAIPGENAGAYRRIGLRVVGRGSWPELLDLLQMLESATPSLVLDGLTLQAPSASLLRAGARSTLEFGLMIHAFRRGEA